MGALELDLRKPQPAIRILTTTIIILVGGAFALGFGTLCVYNPVGPEFRVESATASQLSHNGSADLTSTLNLILVSTNPNRMLDIYLTGLEVSLLSWGQLGGYPFKLALKKQLPSPPGVIKMKNNNRVGVNISFDSDEVGKLISHGSVRMGLNVSAWYNYYKLRVLVKQIVQGRVPLWWEGFCYPLRFGDGKGDQPTACRGYTQF